MRCCGRKVVRSWGPFLHDIGPKLVSLAALDGADARTLLQNQHSQVVTLEQCLDGTL